MLSVLGDGFAEALPERSDELFAYGSWRRAGIRVAGCAEHERHNREGLAPA
jgi:hypothetical protein